MPFAEVHLPVPVDQAFTYEIPVGMALSLGSKVRVPFGPRRIAGYVTKVLAGNPGFSGPVKPIEKVLVAESFFDEAWVDLARWVARLYICSVGEAIDAMIPGGGVVRSRSVDFDDDQPVELDLGSERLPGSLDLSLAQTLALERINTGQDRLLYLFGATGSGKTEVFLRAAETVLARGQTVIYLVPEIALTGQVIADIRQRFAGRAAVLHSQLTPSQRLGEWQRIRRGAAQLVVGARSAVFAPLSNLGLIIVDEEHESSYKNGNTPRYHARQVAMYRLAGNGQLIMGSATPSVEAWYQMSTGRITRLDLPSRVSGGAMPTVRLVDLKGVTGAISPALAQEIRETKNRGAQTILFLNRRGFAYFFHCQSCGFELACSHCSVSLTYHKGRNRMICHHCGRSQEPPRVCPACQSADCGFAGFGIEFVESEIRQLFPDLRVVRVDSDLMVRRGQLADALKAFRDGHIDLLLGTQMVAKGLNVPGLRLAGVILADGGLHLPDFRAAERTFNLLVQVAGRAGRFRPDGLVLIQTLNPKHRVIRQAAELDLGAFYDQELASRQTLEFPPFGRLFRLVFRSKTPAKALEAAEDFAKTHGAAMARVMSLWGPAECSLAQVNGNWRYHILLSCKGFDQAHRVLRSILIEHKTPSGVYIEVDVDPINMF